MPHRELPEIHSALPWALLCLTAATAAAQAPASIATNDLPPLDPTLTFTEVRTELVVPALDVTGGWLELTPLSADGEVSLVRLGNRSVEDGEKRFDPGLPAGPAMLCSGGEPWAVTCDEIYLERGVMVTAAAAPEIEVRFETGVAVTGRYLLDDWPVAGARVAAVPAGLEAGRPYTLPLGLRSGEMRREVVSDGEGWFLLPALAAGRYFLETVLPSGRVHRGDPFDLPAEHAVRAEAAIDDVTAVAWNLGDIDVADGLTVEFQVRDPEGRPIRGALVAGRQGELPATYVSYGTVTDGDGVARISGFTVDEPVHLSCRAEGFAVFEERYDLLPVVFACTLEPLAAVRGEVLAPDGLGAEGAVVSLAVVSEQPATSGLRQAGPAHQATVDLAGRFTFVGLEAGEYRLVAAAPDLAAFETTFDLAAGESLELPSIVLLAGRELRGRVVAAGGGEPIAGAEIRAVEPPGAAWAVSGRDGAFTLAGGGESTLHLAVSAEGYASEAVEVPAERFKAREPLVVELEEAGWIRALVWDTESGLPCRGCRLVVREAREELLTDALGEALSGPLKAGYYQVRRARVDHLGSTVIFEPEAEVRWVRVKGGHVATVRFGDWQDAVRVTFRPAADPGWRLSARTPWRSETALRAADGSFRLRRRDGETQELFLQFWDPLAGAEVEVWQATLPADLEGGELVLPRHTAVVVGRALAGERPIAGERVLLRTIDQGRIHAASRTRPDGGFRIPLLPPGVYALAVGEPNVRIVSLRRGQYLDLGIVELFAGGY